MAEKITQIVNDKKAEFLGILEREIVKNIGGGCNSPFGIYTEIKGVEVGKNEEEVEMETENKADFQKKSFSLYIKFEAFERNISFENEYKLSSLEKEQISYIVSDILSRIKTK